MGQAKNTVDEGFVGDAGSLGGLGHFFTVCNVRVGIGLEDKDFVVGCETKVNSSVVMKLQNAIHLLADPLDMVGNGRFELRKPKFDIPFLAILFIPFDAVGEQEWAVFCIGLEEAFASRKYRQAFVAEYADVEFPTFDIFFSNSRLVPSLVDELGSLGEGGRI